MVRPSIDIPALEFLGESRHFGADRICPLRHVRLVPGGDIQPKAARRAEREKTSLGFLASFGRADLHDRGDARCA